MKISLRRLEPGSVDALMRFSTEMYGREAYQATSGYIEWLYRENPYRSRLDDCLLAFEEDRIVGCIHQMQLPCERDGERVTLSSLQNHVIAPHLRGGVGIMLLQRAVKEAAVAFSPGVHGRLGEAYRRLSYVEVPSFWLRKILRPMGAAIQLARNRIRGEDRRLSIAVQRLEAATKLSVTATPTDAQVTALAAAMRSRGNEGQGPFVAWTPELVRWRFFAEKGPSHVLVGEPGASPWALLSYGLRSGVAVARLIEYEEEGQADFMKDVLAVARRLGATVALSYTSRVQVRDQLLQTGWSPVKNPPHSFVMGAAALSVSAAASDVGFEAIATRVAS